MLEIISIYIELAKKVLQVCPQQSWKTQRNFLINPTSVFSLAAPQPPKVTWIISPEQAEETITCYCCCCLVAELCPTLCDPVACSLPGSSVHGISQAGILEWVAVPFFMGSSWPRSWTSVPCIGRRILYHWVTWEAQRISCLCLKAHWSTLLSSPPQISPWPEPELWDSDRRGFCSKGYLPQGHLPSVALNLPWWASLVGFPGGSDDNLPAMRKRGFSSWVGKIPWRRERLPTPVFWSGEFHGQKLGRLQSRGSKRVGHSSATKQWLSLPSHEDPSYLTNRVTFAKHLASVSVQITLVLFYSESHLLLVIWSLQHK